jgi:hypothetical protein
MKGGRPALAIAALLGFVAGTAGASPPQTCAAVFAGEYRASHMEMGGGLALGADGRFRYELAYGALDEMAEGAWTCEGDAVYLTSDPVTPPRFEVERTGPDARGVLRVSLALPKGMSPQYFSLLIAREDQSEQRADFDRDGAVTVAMTTPSRAVSIRPLLPVYLLAGDPIAVPRLRGAEIDLRFHPNDLGKVAFARTALQREGNMLVLVRFGEAIRLTRLSD